MFIYLTVGQQTNKIQFENITDYSTWFTSYSFYLYNEAPFNSVESAVLVRYSL